MNDLLNIQIIMGTGITSFKGFGHLVYSTHADLIQNIKPELHGGHIKLALINFTEVLNDPTSYYGFSAIRFLLK